MPTNARELQGYRVDIQESCIEVTKTEDWFFGIDIVFGLPCQRFVSSKRRATRTMGVMWHRWETVPALSTSGGLKKDLLTMVKLTPAQFLEFCDLLEPHGCSSTRMGLTHRARVFLFLLRELLNVYFPSHGLSRECYVNGFNFFYIPLSFHF